MDEKQQQKLERSLKSRHVTMIAIGGAIGTGLFLGSGTAIHQAGPSIILSYLIVGIFCFFMMRALGELILADTSKHSFIDSVKEYLGDRMEFVAGWTRLSAVLQWHISWRWRLYSSRASSALPIVPRLICHCPKYPGIF